jgi:hypothetical protein
MDKTSHYDQYAPTDAVVCAGGTWAVDSRRAADPLLDHGCGASPVDALARLRLRSTGMLRRKSRVVREAELEAFEESFSIRAAMTF